MTGKYNQKKGRRNIHRGRRRRRIGMIQTVGVVAVVLLSFMIIIGFVRKNSAELGSESSLNDRQIKYINHDKQDGMMNAQGGDTPWNLILVNNKNHIPKDYKPKLTEVQGGEYVDERIYAPLMEMLEAAREGNGENCRWWCLAIGHQRNSKNFMMRRSWSIKKKGIRTTRQRSWQNSGLLCRDTVNIS